MDGAEFQMLSSTKRVKDFWSVTECLHARIFVLIIWFHS